MAGDLGHEHGADVRFSLRGSQRQKPPSGVYLGKGKRYKYEVMGGVRAVRGVKKRLASFG